MTKNPRFFVMSPRRPASRRPADAPPAWATEYWAWKSGQFAPGSTTYGIDLKEEDRTATATASPMGGSLAKGTPDASGNGGTTRRTMSRCARSSSRTVRVDHPHAEG